MLPPRSPSSSTVNGDAGCGSLTRIANCAGSLIVPDAGCVLIERPSDRTTRTLARFFTLPATCAEMQVPLAPAHGSLVVEQPPSASMPAIANATKGRARITGSPAAASARRFRASRARPRARPRRRRAPPRRRSRPRTSPSCRPAAPPAARRDRRDSMSSARRRRRRRGRRRRWRRGDAGAGSVPCGGDSADDFCLSMTSCNAVICRSTSSRFLASGATRRYF